MKDEELRDSPSKHGDAGSKQGDSEQQGNDMSSIERVALL